MQRIPLTLLVERDMRVYRATVVACQSADVIFTSIGVVGVRFLAFTLLACLYSPRVYWAFWAVLQ